MIATRSILLRLRSFFRHDPSLIPSQLSIEPHQVVRLPRALRDDLRPSPCVPRCRDPEIPRSRDPEIPRSRDSHIFTEMIITRSILLQFRSFFHHCSPLVPRELPIEPHQVIRRPRALRDDLRPGSERDPEIPRSRDSHILTFSIITRSILLQFRSFFHHCSPLIPCQLPIEPHQVVRRPRALRDDLRPSPRVARVPRQRREPPRVAKGHEDQRRRAKEPEHKEKPESGPGIGRGKSHKPAESGIVKIYIKYII
jgi:hypothetical protein